MESSFGALAANTTCANGAAGAAVVRAAAIDVGATVTGGVHVANSVHLLPALQQPPSPRHL